MAQAELELAVLLLLPPGCCGLEVHHHTFSFSVLSYWTIHYVGDICVTGLWYFDYLLIAKPVTELL